MTPLVLTPEQTELVRTHSIGMVLDAHGQPVGHFLPEPSGKNAFTREEIEEAIREAEADPRRIPSEEVLGRLRVRGTESSDATIEEIRLMFRALQRHADANPQVDIPRAVRATGLPREPIYQALIEMDSLPGKTTAEITEFFQAAGA